MSNDLISREALKKVMSRVKWINAADGECARHLIETTPPVDTIRAAGGCYCRECKSWRQQPECINDGFCTVDLPDTEPVYRGSDDFCSHGELKEAEDNV